MALYQIQFVVDGTIYDVGEDVLEYLQEGLSSGTLYQARVRSIENLETSDWTAWAEVFTLEDLSINVNDSVVVQEDISTLVEIVGEDLSINVNDEISINDTFVEVLFDELIAYYEIQVRVIGAAEPSWVNVGDVLEYNSTSLDVNTGYEARVRRVEGAETSAPTDWVAAYTLDTILINVHDSVTIQENINVFELIIAHDTLVEVLSDIRIEVVDYISVIDWVDFFFSVGFDPLNISTNDSVATQEDISTLVQIVDENLIINVNDEISINDTFVEIEILKVLSINVNDSVVVQEFNNQFIDIAFIDTFSINVNDEINVVPNSNVITFATITKSPPYVYIKGDEEWISVRLLINEGPDNWQEKELTCFGG